MMTLAALLLAHLATDFLFQPKSLVRHKLGKKSRSIWLYIHAALSGMLAYILVGALEGNWGAWPVFAVTAVSHFFIDLWKLNKGDSAAYFFIDQLMHLLVILGLTAFYTSESIVAFVEHFSLSSKLIYHVLFVIFLTFPAGIILRKFLSAFQFDELNEYSENDRKQQQQQENQYQAAESLPKAGLWIGIFERLIIYFLVVNGQFLAITFLITAKSILRLAPEKDRQQSEYILVGTLASLFLAFTLGLIIKTF